MRNSRSANSRADIIGNGLSVTEAGSDLLGISGSGDAVSITGTGSALWLGGNGASGAYDTVTAASSKLTLGDSARVYAAGGPVMEWVDYQLDGPEGEGLDSDSTGFGTGGYARAGIEFLVSPDTLLGLGVRWSDTTVDLGAALGDLEVRGYQVTLTVTQGL